MAMVECAVCGRMTQSRSARSCGDCGAPLCEDCARENQGFCAQCRDGGWQ
ncbi:MAG TPA: hypothetical protein IAA84_06755 [Candidatus Alectryocaccomicrobium excrementavium]|uniref:Uncharacterized protein n=1 Tax=Candidatus Alectryocaccomicrobium excrementavium TaxID=2840668 RepID=A0A9D1G0A7_9FIRM|nr:hypothetical protein [Candidatus Alectryocaccomicrobium excrementavium]